MDAEMKNKWVAVLRSGEYQQCRGTLRRTDDEGNKSFCCLGVLCEINGHPVPDLRSRTTSGNLYDLLAEWIGEDNSRTLQMKNDGARGTHQHSFLEIADWIEVNL